MLGRLIVRMEDLYALGQRGRDTMPREGRGWRIACLLPVIEQSQLRANVQDIQQFNANHNQNHESRAVIDTVELKVNTVAELELAVKFLPEWLSVFLETPYDLAAELVPLMAQAGRQNLHAKFRTGGVNSDLIPGADEVIHALAVCAGARVAFKATAGLHHPVRAVFPLTYEQNAERCQMHGFLNVLAATSLLLADPADRDKAMEAIQEEDASSFSIDEHGWQWRDHSFTVDDIVRLRTQGLKSFGSCSFIEPIEDLNGMNVDLIETMS